MIDSNNISARRRFNSDVDDLAEKFEKELSNR